MPSFESWMLLCVYILWFTSSSKRLKTMIWDWDVFWSEEYLNQCEIVSVDSLAVVSLFVLPTLKKIINWFFFFRSIVKSVVLWKLVYKVMNLFSLELFFSNYAQRGILFWLQYIWRTLFSSASVWMNRLVLWDSTVRNEFISRPKACLAVLGLFLSWLFASFLWSSNCLKFDIA